VSKKDKALVARVERLVNGDCGPADLDAIFLTLREFAYGRECLKELGHFIAHRAERDARSICTQRFLDFHTALPTYLTTSDKPFDPSDLPDDHVEFLRASFRMLGPREIAAMTGLREGQLSKLLESVLDNIQRLSNGKLGCVRMPNVAERKLWHCLANREVFRPAFDDASLIADLWHSLEKNKLVAAADKARIWARKPLIAAFAIAKMHQSRLVHELKSIEAQINCGIFDGNLIAFSSMSTPGCPVPVCIPIFRTEVAAKDHCTKELLSKGAATTWDCAIELNNDLKLTSLSKERPFTETTVIRDHNGKITVDPA